MLTEFKHLPIRVQEGYSLLKDINFIIYEKELEGTDPKFLDGLYADVIAIQSFIDYLELVQKDTVDNISDNLNNILSALKYLIIKYS